MTELHERGAIIAIGDELAIGQSLDTNSRWLANQLTAAGAHVIEHVTAPDDAQAMLGALQRLAQVADVIIATGGLGPTADDLSREVMAIFLGEGLVRDEEAHRDLVEMFRTRGRELTDANAMQALRPASARCLANAYGTAPGLHAVFPCENRSVDVFFLPGPPHENQSMFERFVVPALRTSSNRIIRTRVIHHYGPAESDAARELGALLDRDRNPLVGITASDGVISLRIRYEGSSADAERLIEVADAAALDVLASHRFAVVDEPGSEAALPLFAALVGALKQQQGMLVTAESCTGGMFGELITGIAGASDVFAGGWVTYSNAMKHHALRVPTEVIDTYGAVSIETAKAMASGALRASEGATHALAITGIAGPGGGTDDKPVGTVCIARASLRDEIDARRFVFLGDRATVRRRSCTTAAAMLLFHVLERNMPRLLWQIDDDGSPMG